MASTSTANAKTKIVAAMTALNSAHAETKEAVYWLKNANDAKFAEELDKLGLEEVNRIAKRIARLKEILNSITTKGG